VIAILSIALIGVIKKERTTHVVRSVDSQ